MSLISKLYDKKISSKGLGVFRIFFSFILLLEVIRIFRFRQLYFDPIPFIERNLLSSEIAFTLWICTLIALLVGAYTRISALINYIFVLIFISHMGSFEYHMDYTYIGVSFLMIFIPMSKSYSIDRSFFKIRHNIIPIEKTSVLSYWLIIFLGVGLIYISSTVLKFQSNAWLNGLGLWLPASIPQMTIVNNQWLLNQEYLIKFLGYFTLLFEFLFLFIFWIKRLRPFVFLIGIGLHLGILIEFPIPLFAIGYVVIYTLFIPVSFWSKVEVKLQNRMANLSSFFRDLIIRFQKRYCNSNSINSLNFGGEDFFNTFLNKSYKIVCIKFFVVTVLVLQLLTIIRVPIKHDFLKNLHSNINKASSKFLGISEHGVFLDGHYDNYSTIYSLKYDGKLLPLFDEFGMPVDYVKAGIWADFGFRVNRPNVEKNIDDLKKGLIRYTAFFAKKNNINLNDTEFTIIKKTVRASYNWEPNLLLENRMNPWIEVGEVTWENKDASVNLMIKIN